MKQQQQLQCMATTAKHLVGCCLIGSGSGGSSVVSGHFTSCSPLPPMLPTGTVKLMGHFGLPVPGHEHSP